MEFGELMGLAVVMGVLFVVFPAVLFNGIARVRAAKAKAGAGGVVARETHALRQRIEVLEEIATARSDDFKLLNASPSQLTLPVSDEEEEQSGSTPGRTPARA